MAVNGGVKNWASGQVLDAADLNEYVADQTIARFATIADRTAAYGVANAPSLQKGLFSWVESTEKLYYYDGTSWVEVGAQVEDGEITEAKLANSAVTSAKILDGTIVNADVNAAAAIDKTKISGTAITAADTGTVTSTMIADGTIVNADINAAAAIALSKLASGTSGQVIVANSSGVPTYVTLSGNVTVSDTGVTTVNSDMTFSNIKTTSTIEVLTISATAATGTVNVDVANGTTYYTTNSSANWTVNLRWNSSTSLDSKLAIGEMATTTFMVTNGATPRLASAHQIGGNAVTPKWQGGTAPAAGNANSIDMYTYTVVKTAANTFSLFAALTRFA